MSDLTDPNRASNLPLAPETPQHHKRVLGVLVAAALAGALAAGAWYLQHRAPPANSNSTGVFQLP